MAKFCFCSQKKINVLKRMQKIVFRYFWIFSFNKIFISSFRRKIEFRSGFTSTLICIRFRRFYENEKKIDKNILTFFKCFYFLRIIWNVCKKKFHQIQSTFFSDFFCTREQGYSYVRQSNEARSLMIGHSKCGTMLSIL